MDRNDLLAATRAEFMHSFTVSLDEAIQLGAVHLFHKADSAPSLPEQGRLLDARSILMNKEIALKRNLISAMEHLLNRSFQTAYSTFRPSFYDSLSASSLSLIDTTAFEDELHIDEITKRFRESAEEEWRDLNIRVALLFEQDDIKERENPFRAYLFARCIVTALESLEVPSDLMVPLTQQLAEDLTDKIANIYKKINALLAGHGIAAQLQLKIRKSPEAGGSMPASSLAESGANPEQAGVLDFSSGEMDARARNLNKTWSPIDREVKPKGKVDRLLDWVTGKKEAVPVPAESGQGGAQWPGSAGEQVPAGGGEIAPQSVATATKKGWLGGAQAVGEVLRDFFTGGRAQAPLPDDYEAFEPNEMFGGGYGASPLTASVGTMQKISTPSALEMHGEDGKIRNLILEHRDELSDISSNANEQMIIDIVAMLFEFILRDGHVPAEVRAQLGRLQFLVLKVALLDPDLFTQKSHPARMLVNRIGSIVLGLQELDPGGERVTGEICRIVEVLLTDTSEGVAIFSQMLDEFDAFVATELRTADKQVERAVQVMEHAENRTLQYARITALISEAMTHLKVDDFLHDFLVNTWARVVERAERGDVVRAKRFRLLVPDLIWSIIPKVTEDDRRQLFGLIPSLLEMLREGVALIGWGGQQQQVLLDWLVDSHRHALRASNLPAPPPPLALVYESFEAFINTQTVEQPLAENERWYAPDGKLLEEAIQEMEVELNLLDKMFDLEMAQETEEQLSSYFDSEILSAEDGVFERLRSGVAIEIFLDVTPTRARLNWVSPSASNLVLSIEDVPVPSMVSVKMFKRLMEKGRIRFLEAEPLFERAVQALLESADHLDSSGEGAH